MPAAGLPVPFLDVVLGAPVRAGFTTRAGGVSGPPWSTLNLAGHVGDDAAAVEANRRRLAEALEVDRVRFADQVHGTGVAVVGAADASVGRADALVTAAPGVALAVLVADCLPVLLVEPAAAVVAAVHAGRVGLAAGVVQAALSAMAELGGVARRTTAVIGPAVCGGCYEVPVAMRDEIAARLPGAAAISRQGTAALDLPAGAERLLRHAGVADVRRVPACTVEDERFFSHRREGDTGRFAGVVVLRP